MISDSKIRDLINYIYDEFMLDNVNVDGQRFNDIHDCLNELITARQTIAELKEDGERLARELDAAIFIIHEYPIDYRNYNVCHGIDEGEVLGQRLEKRVLEGGSTALEQHYALMEKLEGK